MKDILVHALDVNGIDNRPSVTTGVYLHGKLQDMNGFDLVDIENMPTEEGIYECKVQLAGKTDYITAKLYFWKDKEIFPGRDRGLIVWRGDLVATYYAIRKFKERAGMI